MIGKFAVSKAGHDKGQLYIIVAEEKEFVYLSNGRQRTVDSPKKKRKKHIQPINKTAEEMLSEELRRQENVQNEKIKYAIKQYLLQK